MLSIFVSIIYVLKAFFFLKFFRRQASEFCYLKDLCFKVGLVYLYLKGEWQPVLCNVNVWKNENFEFENHPFVHVCSGLVGFFFFF